MSDEFDKEFKRMGTAIIILFVITAIVILAILSGSAWAIYRLMLYFGIV